MVDFLESTGALTIALAQPGDFIGGASNQNASAIRLTRKAMNSFVCATARRFRFNGRINEDVNAYTKLGSVGGLFLTTTQVSIDPSETQQRGGGMSGIYKDSGTYVKSFYTVMQQPSSVVVASIRGRASERLHHRVDWRRTVPKIVHERHRKA